MKKSKVTRSLLAACSIVALTAVMYGCVHDGGSDTTTDETDMEMPTPVAVTLPSNIPAGMTPGAGTHMIAAGGSVSVNGVNFACAAGEDACTVTIAADGTAMSTGGAVTATLSTAAQDKIAADEKAEKDRKALEDAEKLANQAKMEGLFAAIKGEVTGTVEHPAGEAEVEVSVVKGVTIVKFEASGGTITATTPSVTLADSAVYTVREDPERALFTKHYEDRLTEPSDVLTLVSATDGEHAESTHFPLNGGTASYTDDQTTDDDLPDSIALRGTLMGATGTYLCGTEGTGSTTCTISEDKSVFTFGSGWTFDADDGQMVTVADADYTQYGWWAYKRKDGTYRVGTYYDHVGPTASDVAAAPGATGTATYTGNAAGKYAIDNRPTGNVLDAGHFTADATIVADLDATTPTVSGTINGFMTGETPRDWSVALGSTGITFQADTTGPDFNTVAADGTSGDSNVWTIGDVKGAADGDWQGGFYHDGDARDDGTPSNVVGSFSASHGSTAFMVGAFGAANQADDRPQ